MAEIRFNVDGLNDLSEKLKAAGPKVTRSVGDAVKHTTDRGVQVAKQEAPVRTGRLRSEIDGVATALSGLITSHAPYSGWVNFGNSRQSPNAYMSRAAEAISEEFRRSVGEAGEGVL